MVEQHFSRCESNLSIYYKVLDNSEFLLPLLYIDDMPMFDTSMNVVSNLKQQLAHGFIMKNLRAVKRILGMTIV